MAVNSHWVNDVFPVEFSLDDLLSHKEDKIDLKNSKLRYDRNDVCNRILANEQHPSRETPELPVATSRNNCTAPNDIDFICNYQSDGIIKSHAIVLDADKPQVATKSEGCMWTKEELEIFREGYFKLKKQSVQLLILLSESKKESKKLKKICKEDKSKISTQNCLINEQKKQNMRLNATIKELRIDLQSCEEKVKLLTRLESQLKDQKRFMKTELDEERENLEKARELCTKLDKALKDHRKETALGYMQKENVLKAKHLHAIEKLEKENGLLRCELEKERYDHQVTKTALEQLRKHITNMQISTSNEKYLDITEIDRFAPG